MKLKYTFVTNEVSDKIVAIAVGEDMVKFNGFIKMNDIGAYIFDLLKTDVTEEEMVNTMKKDFPDENEEEIRKNITYSIEQLKKSDVLEQ